MEASKTTIHQGHRDRVREKAKQGLQGFHDHEILEYLLFAGIPRKDVNEIAHALLDAFGTFAGVLDASFDELRQIKGMTDNAALLLSTLPQVFERYQLSKNDVKQKIRSRGDVLSYAKAKIGNRTYEIFLVLCLDVKKQLLKCIEFKSGSNYQVNVSVKDVVTEAVKCGAYYVATAHNHPSGDITPSLNDVLFCKELAKAFSTIGILYVDNVIVGKKDSISFADVLSDVKRTSTVNEALFDGNFLDLLDEEE